MGAHESAKPHLMHDHVTLCTNEVGDVFLPIPKVFLEKLGWKVGDYIKIEMHAERPGWVILERVPPKWYESDRAGR